MRDVPPHVVEHYTHLFVDELLTDVLAHYQKNVLPKIVALVRGRASESTTPGLVLEGSALWPEFVAPLLSDKIAAVCLLASEELVTGRMHPESKYHERAAQEQFLIEKFLERTLVFGRRMERAIRDHGLLSVRACAGDTVEYLSQKCLGSIAANRFGR